MTQTQSKQTPSLVSVDRSSRGALSARATPVANTERAQATKRSTGEEATLSEDGAFDGFVFEEAGAAVAASPTREPAAQPVTRSSAPRSEPASRKEAPSSANVVVLTAATEAPKVAAPSTPAGVVNDVAKAPEAVDDRPKDPATEPASTAATSVSGRGDLELRAKLNQKEADLLALRGELSARDRLLLELNNTSLEIERSRFELSELLEQHTLLLSEARERIRALEAEKEANEKRIADMKAAFRGSEANWKRKLESELESLKIEHAAELAAHASAHATKLEQVGRSHAAEVERLFATHAAADEDAKTKHAEALKKAEAASNQALANVIAKYSKKVRSLQEVQEQALAKAAASHAATLEAAVAAAASDKATMIAEAESAQRAAQGELTTALGTIQFLERTQASQAERIARQESRIVTLEESLRLATERADAGEETLASLRRTLATGLSLLNPRTPEES